MSDGLGNDLVDSANETNEELDLIIDDGSDVGDDSLGAASIHAGILKES